MPRFKTTPEISGLTTPDGESFWANEWGVFDIPAHVIPIFESHGVQLTPFTEVVVVHVTDDTKADIEVLNKVMEEIKPRRGRPPKTPEGV